jgi:hypothetical protein
LQPGLQRVLQVLFPSVPLPLILLVVAQEHPIANRNTRAGPLTQVENSLFGLMVMGCQLHLQLQ